MFNLTFLLISLSAPAAIMIGLFLSDLFLKTDFTSAVIVLIFLEQRLIGKPLGVGLEKSLGGGGGLSFSGNPVFYVATMIFDYLLVAFVVYVLLTALTKCLFR